MNLVEVIEILQKKARDIVNEHSEKQAELTAYYQNKLNEIQTAISVNMELNTTCLTCKGEGTIIGEDNISIKCPDCLGNGIIDK